MMANTIVLVADDKPAIAELLKYALHDDEWVWHSVPDLALAWEFIGHVRPGLLLQESMQGERISRSPCPMHP